MLNLASHARIFVHTGITDMRKGFSGLSGIVREQFQADPTDGSLFVFVNRRRDRIKILYWGQTGFCIWYQQLQKGTYQLPDEQTLEGRETVEVTRAQLSLILDGIDLSSARQRMRFQARRDLANRGEPTTR